MRNLILVALLMIPLAGCQSTSVEQDPTGKTLPLGTISTLNLAFHPNSLPYVRSVSIWRFEKIPDIVGVGATGAYIPYTKTILLADDATYPDRTLVHEMLHVVFFKEEYPFPELFTQDLERFLQDEDYKDVVASIESSLEDYRNSLRFPEAFIDDEYYAYLGERLYAQNRGGEHGLPDYMARHYRGVLNPLLYFDHRFYEGKIRPKVECIRATFKQDGRTFVVTDTLLKIRALVRHGGVVQKKDETATSDLIVGSVGAGKTATIGRHEVVAGTKPSSVSFQLDTASYRYSSSFSAIFISYEVWSNEKFLFSLDGGGHQQLLQNFVHLTMSWDTSEQLFELYLQKRLDIRVRPHYAMQTKR